MTSVKQLAERSRTDRVKRGTEGKGANPQATTEANPQPSQGSEVEEA